MIKKRVSVGKALGLGFMVELGSGLYGGDRAGKYFIFISILKLIKTILKLTYIVAKKLITQ